MNPGVRTPLVDFFVRGEVDRDVRLLAARGAMAPRAHEQLALLAILSEDADDEVRTAAQQTLRSIPPGALASFIARSDVPAELRAFILALGLDPAATPAGDADQPLIDTAPAEPEVAAVSEDAPPAEEAGEAPRTTILQKVSQMNVVEKMTAGMKGSREERTILIRDSNKLVTAAVLSSPKLTEAEVESYAKMTSMSEEVLRIIGTNRAWIKNYLIAAALAKNPKTPLAMSLRFMNRLNDKDLKMLTIDRNVPETLRTAARKRLVKPGSE
jgi:hypothetical protein